MGFNFLGEDRSSAVRLYLWKGTLHGAGADGFLPSRKAMWSVLLNADPSLVFPPAHPVSACWGSWLV